jgi:hypothetical protein
MLRKPDLGVSVQKTWTGGDGSMTGTVIITMIPYSDIGELILNPGQQTPMTHGIYSSDSNELAFDSFPIRRNGREKLGSAKASSFCVFGCSSRSYFLQSGYAWPESHVTRIKRGWNRWRVM